MAGLRERKKEQNRQRIAAAALRLFVERGFDAVTVNEIAEAAEVAKATLFSYFPTKESLVLHGVGGDDLAGVVAHRSPGETFLAALRSHHRALAGQVAEADTDTDALLTRVGVIQGSAALRSAADALVYRQREALAHALAAECGDRAAAFAAAQITAALLTLQQRYFQHLLGGMSAQDAAHALAEDTEFAFDLLELGLHHLEGQ